MEDLAMLPGLRRLSIWPNTSDDFFGRDLLSDFFDTKTGVSVPAVNIAEDKDNFKIEVAAPGLDKKDFKIDLDNNVLTVSSEKKMENEDKNGSYLRREFSYSAFKRSFTLPESVEAEKIAATHKDGVLTVNVPKKEEAKQKPPKKIAIS